MSNRNTRHTYGIAVEGTKADNDRIIEQIKDIDPTAFYRQLGICGYFYSNEKDAALVCKLAGDEVKLIRKP